MYVSMNLNEFLIKYNYVRTYVRILILPYSELFSLGANFPEFHKWAHNSRKFILGYMYKV